MSSQAKLFVAPLADYLGDSAKGFPLLIKLIDACDKLSIQVHPDDDYYHYVFKEWQLDYTNVTKNMTIAPSFTPVHKEQ